MAGKKTGATSKSTSRYVLDSGVIVLNYGETDERPIGATQEGVTYTLEQDVRMVDIDGHRGPVQGARRVISETARITGGILEMTSGNLQRIIFGSDVTTENNHEVVRRQQDLPNASDYMTNVALLGRVQGSAQDFIGILYNALNDGGFELETEDEGELTMAVQFTAHTPADEPDVSPWDIRFPSDVNGPIT